MGSFGSEFIDVLTVIGVSRSESIPTVNLTAEHIARLTAAMSALMTGVAQGAVVYFAPATYVIHRHPTRVDRAWEGDLIVPRVCTAWFEAGAVLELRGPARVVLNGALIAPQRQIFREGTHGMVMLGGALEGVHPEWWGALGQPGHDDTDALQRAIDASSVRRHQFDLDHLPSPRWEFRRPLPVLLARRYEVTRELVIGRALGIPPNPTATPPHPEARIQIGLAGRIAATLRGTIAQLTGPSTGISASLRSERPFGGTTMLRTFRSTGTIIENVLLDGSDNAATCLAIEAPYETTAQSTSIRGCAFRGATAVLLRLGAEPQVNGTATIINHDTGQILYDAITRNNDLNYQSTAVTVPRSSLPDTSGDFVGLLIEECLFRVDGGTAENTRAIEVAAPNLCPGRIVDCRFTGHASAFIDAVSGWFLLEGCHFDNTRLPSSRSAVVAVETIVNGRATVSLGSLGFEPPNASDVYIREEVFPVADSTQVPPGYVPAALAMTGCTSRSAMLLDTIRPSTVFGQRPRRSVLLLGNLHAPPSDRRQGVEASVRWGRARINPQGAHSISLIERMNADTSLSIMACALPMGFAVYQGAAQSALMASAVGGGNQPQGLSITFPPTRSGFQARTLVFGLAMLLLSMLGCHGSARTQAQDAQTLPDELARIDAGLSMDGAVDAPWALDAHDVTDAVAMALDAHDATDAVAAPIDLQVIHDDLGHILLTDLGEPRQQRRNCPATSVGEMGIAAPRLRAPGTTMRVTSQRPTLEWILPVGVTGARVEICRDPCCMTPVAMFDAEGAQGRPPQALPPGVLFWRVRGKIGERVGRDTSFTWEFGVRRRDTPTDTTIGSIHDFNGDGFDDVAVSFLQPTRTSVLKVFFGSPSLLGVSNTQNIPVIGEGVTAVVGDFNGDGFSDLFILSTVQQITQSDSRAVVAYGGRAGLRLDGTALRLYGSNFVVGDFNGDGMSDLASGDGQLVNNDGYGSRRVKIIYGSSDGLGRGGAHYIANPGENYRYSHFWPIASPGDLNGDGYSELMVGDDGLEVSAFLQGRVYMFDGDHEGVRPTPSGAFDFPDMMGRYGRGGGFGYGAWAIGDFNGDRVGDFAIYERNVAHINIYASGGPHHAQYSGYLSAPTSENVRTSFALFGTTVSSGDSNGDGRPELIVGCAVCAERVEGAVRVGRVYAYDLRFGSASILQTLVGPEYPLGRQPDLFGYQALSGVDLDSDGYDEVVFTSLPDEYSSSDPGSLFVLRGGPQGIGSQPAQALGDQLPVLERRRFGLTLAGVREREGGDRAFRS